VAVITELPGASRVGAAHAAGSGGPLARESRWSGIGVGIGIRVCGRGRQADAGVRLSGGRCRLGLGLDRRSRSLCGLFRKIDVVVRLRKGGGGGCERGKSQHVHRSLESPHALVSLSFGDSPESTASRSWATWAPRRAAALYQGYVQAG